MIDQAKLAEAEAALCIAASESPERTAAMTRFMVVVEDLAREVAAGTLTWDELATWARDHAEVLLAAQPALAEWGNEMGRLYYVLSGEEGTEAALYRRSQQAFARELFKGTAADAALAAFEDAAVDADFREGAEGIYRPDYIPSSHMWWPK